MAIGVWTEIRKQSPSEFGYGQYVVGLVFVFDPEVGEYGAEMGCWASECIPFDASKEEVRKARSRVRNRARRAYKKALRGL